MAEVKYKRILLKVSGEALAGDAHRGLDFSVINSVCESIRQCRDMGVQVGLVIDSFGSAFVASIVISIVSALVNALVGKD